jgi:hypothetical protein
MKVVVTVTRNAAGQAQELAVLHRPRNTLLLFSREMNKKFAGTPPSPGTSWPTSPETTIPGGQASLPSPGAASWAVRPRRPRGNRELCPVTQCPRGPAGPEEAAATPPPSWPPAAPSSSRRTTRTPVPRRPRKPTPLSQRGEEVTEPDGVRFQRPRRGRTRQPFRHLGLPRP